MKEGFFSAEQIALMKSAPCPHHVAILMDGNRRWEQQKERSQSLSGHRAGAKVLLDIVAAARELEIRVLTVFAFSTENWRRPRKEVDILFHLFESQLKEHSNKLVRHGIKFNVIGDLAPLPRSIQQAIAKVKGETCQGSEMELVIAFNYGSRDEIKRSVQAIGRKIASGSLLPEEITEETIANHLDTAHLPDPDLWIRTSGEQRISNFLLWQIAYCEIYFTDVLWPDFTAQHFFEALRSFQSRERRIGK